MNSEDFALQEVVPEEPGITEWRVRYLTKYY